MVRALAFSLCKSSAAYISVNTKGFFPEGAKICWSMKKWPCRRHYNLLFLSGHRLLFQLLQLVWLQFHSIPLPYSYSQKYTCFLLRHLLIRSKNRHQMKNGVFRIHCLMHNDSALSRVFTRMKTYGKHRCWHHVTRFASSFSGFSCISAAVSVKTNFGL